MAKPKIRRPSLKKALQRVDRMPKDLFGDIDVDLSTLPCLTKAPKEKITGNFDADMLALVREFAHKHGVSYTNVMNDILRKAFGLS